MHTNNHDKKPFPWRCPNCRARAVVEATVDYVTQMHHDEREYTVKVAALKTPKCDNCGQVKLDAEALEAITLAFVRQINLLTPEQIRAHRLKTSLTQQELATALGISEAMVARWESGGQIQARSLDNLLRLFFGLAQVREILTTRQIGTLPGRHENTIAPAP